MIGQGYAHFMTYGGARSVIVVFVIVAPNVAGYLTSGSSSVMPNAPPPVINDSHNPDNLLG